MAARYAGVLRFQKGESKMKKGIQPAIVALFSKSPYALQPWADAGYYCINFDKDAYCGHNFGQDFDAFDLRQWQGLIEFFDEEGIVPVLVVAFPPCDDLAVCGAKHFAGKRERGILTSSVKRLNCSRRGNVLHGTTDAHASLRIQSVWPLHCTGNRK